MTKVISRWIDRVQGARLLLAPSPKPGSRGRLLPRSRPQIIWEQVLCGTRRDLRHVCGSVFFLSIGNRQQAKESPGAAAAGAELSRVLTRGHNVPHSVRRECKRRIMLSSGDTPPPPISTRLVADRQQKGTCDCADCASLSALPLCPKLPFMNLTRIFGSLSGRISILPPPARSR
jgi:hypothetical protein